MATIPSPTLQSKGVSTLDVLWAFYQSQTNRVKKAFLKRVAEEENATKESAVMKAYEQTLTDEQRSAAYEFVGRRVGRSAKDFLRELQTEDV